MKMIREKAEELYNNREEQNIQLLQAEENIEEKQKLNTK